MNGTKSSDSAYQSVSLPQPLLFWTCPLSDPASASQLASNPFDRQHLGFDALFGDDVRFVHVPPAVSSELAANGTAEWMHRIAVPVLGLGAGIWSPRGIESVTMGAVCAGFAWLAGILLGRGRL